MNLNSMRPFFDRQFWLIGITLFVAASFFGAWKFAWAWASATATRETATRAVLISYPQLTWAFKEMDACDHGVGRYSEYRHTAECERAVRARVQQHDQVKEFDKALLLQSSLVSIQ